MAQYFQVGDQYAGKSLQDVFDESARAGKYIPRLDVLSNQVGVDPNAKLQSGQTFQIANPDLGSGEYKFLGSTFGNPLSEQQYQTQQAQKAIAPAVQTLQGGLDPLKQRYDELISSIKGQQQQARQQADIATTNEFGKRGVPISSGIVQQAIGQADRGVDTTYNAQSANTLYNYQNSVNGVNSAIAQLQSQAGMTGLNNGIDLTKFGQQLTQNQNQFNSSNALEQAKLQAQLQSAGVGDAYTVVGVSGGRAIVLNKQTGQTQVIATGGGGGGGGSSDPLGLF